MTVDLHAEYCAAIDGMTHAAALMVEAMGVSRATIAHGAFGRMRVCEAGSRWHPDEAGAWRLIVPVHDAHGVLIDLLALSSADGDAWTLRSGDGFALGMEALARAAMTSAEAAFYRANDMDVPDDLRAMLRLRLHANPMAMLRAGGDGICVLDWRPAALVELRMLGPEVTLLVDDDRAAAALVDQMQWGGLPSVRTAGGSRASAMGGRLAA